MQSSAVQAALLPLVGRPLRALGRVANMLCLEVGGLRPGTNRHGEPITHSDWALHIQCSWRLHQRGKIVVARQDFYYSQAGDALEDWDESGTSHFDHMSQVLNAKWATAPPCILAITTDAVGGFSMELDQEYHLDVFPNASTLNEYAEHWRLFMPGTENEHFVVA